MPKPCLSIFGLLSILMMSYTATAQTGDYQDRYAGFLEPQKTAILNMMIDGVVENVRHSPQDIVKKDDLLIQLDTERYELERDLTRAELEIARMVKITEQRIRLQYSVDNLDIVRQLYNLDPNAFGGTRVASEKELKEAMQSKDIAEIQLKNAQMEAGKLEIRLAQVNLSIEQHSLKAPFDGVIVPFSSVETLKGASIKRVEVGETVRRETPATAMMKVDRLRLRWILPKNELGKVYLGQPATVYVDGFNDRPVSAEVVFISPTVTSVDNFDIRVEFSNPLVTEEPLREGAYPYLFRPGMRARLELSE